MVKRITADENALRNVRLSFRRFDDGVQYLFIGVTDDYVQLCDINSGSICAVSLDKLSDIATLDGRPVFVTSLSREKHHLSIEFAIVDTVPFPMHAPFGIGKGVQAASDRQSRRRELLDALKIE